VLMNTVTKFASNRNKGFSLIELSFIIVLMGILIAITVPRLGSDGVSTKRLEVTSKALATDLQYARQLAISTKTTHYVYVDDFNNEFAVYESSVQASNIVKPAYSFNSSISVNGDDTFGFEANGSIVVGSGTSIELDDAGDEWTISVVPATGSIKKEQTGGS